MLFDFYKAVAPLGRVIKLLRLVLFVALFFLPSADKLRVKSGKTMVAMCGRRGKASFDEAVAMRERQQAKLLRTGFCLICGAKASRGKKHF